VTIDATGYQRDIARTIPNQQADYGLSLKENQDHLHQNTVELFAHTEQTRSHTPDTEYIKTVDKGSGRLDIRDCWMISDPCQFPYLRTATQRPGLQTLVKVRRERRLADATTVEVTITYPRCLKPLPRSSTPFVPTGKLKMSCTR